MHFQLILQFQLRMGLLGYNTINQRAPGHSLEERRSLPGEKAEKSSFHL